MSSFSNKNGNWTSGNSIPVLVDPSPYNVWTNWGADQWDLFFLDSNGNYVSPNANIPEVTEAFHWYQKKCAEKTKL